MGESNGVIFESVMLTALGPWDFDPFHFDWRMATIRVNWQGIYIVRGVTYLVRFSSIDKMDSSDCDAGTIVRLRLKKTRRALFLLSPSETATQLRNIVGTMMKERLGIEEVDLKILALLSSGVRDEASLKAALGEEIMQRINQMKEAGLLDSSLKPTQALAKKLAETMTGSWTKA